MSYLLIKLKKKLLKNFINEFERILATKIKQQVKEKNYIRL